MTADPPTTVSKVEVRWVEDEVFLGNDENGHSVVFDSNLASPTKRGRPKGIGPMTGLLSSLGACSGMDVAAILRKRKQSLRSLRVEVSGTRPEFGHPKPFIEIHLRFMIGGDELEEKYVKEAVTDGVTKFCSVAATINGRVKISHSYEISSA